MKIRRIDESSEYDVCYKVSQSEHAKRVIEEVCSETFGNEKNVELNIKYKDFEDNIDILLDIWMTRVSLKDKICTWNEFVDNEGKYLQIYKWNNSYELPNESELIKYGIEIVEWVDSGRAGYYNYSDDYIFFNEGHLMTSMEENLFLNNRDFMKNLFHKLINDNDFYKFFQFNEEVEFDYVNDDQSVVEYINKETENAATAIENYYNCEEIVEPILYIQSEKNKIDLNK